MLCVVLTLVCFAAPAMAQEDLSDPRIKNRVEDEIVDDPIVSLGNIDVEVDAGMVVLNGVVDNVLTRQRAERIAGSVRGVVSVDNDLVVEPMTERADAEIKADVIGALVLNPATEAAEVDVAVDDGAVVLSGQVESWQERLMAERAAQGVRGVRMVTNDILVQYEPDRPDSEIKPEVEARLRHDIIVDHTDIIVEVEDGEVDLTGSVGSTTERDRAYMDAWVAGVKEVDISGLEVAQADTQKAEETPLTETEILAAVETELFYDPSVPEEDVDVVVDDGTVRLYGTVESLSAKQSAAATARLVEGVDEVANLVTVAPGGERPTDEELEEKVEAAITRDEAVSGLDVTPTARNGVVVLHGEVENIYQKSRAANIAAQVRGVREVENELLVSGEGPYPDPYRDWNDYTDYDYDYFTYTRRMPEKPDAELLEDVRDELFWSPFVDSDEVNVTVEQGEVTLTGTVDDWAERVSATNQAFDAGAVWVDNQLEVE
jgi:osmotically-inducible protein OsmY